MATGHCCLHAAPPAEQVPGWASLAREPVSFPTTLGRQSQEPRPDPALVTAAPGQRLPAWRSLTVSPEVRGHEKRQGRESTRKMSQRSPGVGGRPRPLDLCQAASGSGRLSNPGATCTCQLLAREDIRTLNLRDTVCCFTG